MHCFLANHLPIVWWEKNGIEKHTLLAIEASKMLLEDGTPNEESHILQQQSDQKLIQIVKQIKLGEMVICSLA